MKAPSMTPEEARRFDRFSIANAAAVEHALPCGCAPYVDVFTYRRWQAQGMQVQKGQRAVKIPTISTHVSEDKTTGERKVYRRRGMSAVFCRCQVEARS